MIGPGIDTHMNRAQAISELLELIDHAKTVVEEINAGKYDEDGEFSYQVAIAHLMDHLACAWHFAHMTDDQVLALTQQQFEAITNAIPKLADEQRLVEPGERVV